MRSPYPCVFVIVTITSAGTARCTTDVPASKEPPPPTEPVSCELVSCPQGECRQCPEVVATELPPAWELEREAPVQFRFEPVEPAPVLPVEGSDDETLALRSVEGRVVLELRSPDHSEPERISNPEWIVMAAAAAHPDGPRAVCWTRLGEAGGSFVPPQEGNETVCRYRPGRNAPWGSPMPIPQTSKTAWLLGIERADDETFELAVFEDPRGDLVYDWAPEDVRSMRWDGETFGQSVVRPEAAGEWH